MNSNLFNLEGAIVAKAHAKLRTEITEAMAPIRKLLGTLPAAKQQDFRLAFDKYEHQLFAELQKEAEGMAMQEFMLRMDEVGELVAAHRRRVPLVDTDK